MRLAVDAREVEGRPTGVGRVVMGLLRAWPDLDQVEIVCRRAPTIDLPRRFGLTVAPGPRAMPGSVWEQTVLPAVVRRQGVDAMLCPGYGMPRWAPAPVAVCMHDCAPFALPTEFTRRERWRRRWSARVAARHAAFLFMGSRFAAAEAHRHLAVEPGRTLVVPWGLDESFREPPEDADRVRQAYALPERSVLFVGSSFGRRALAPLAEQVSALASERPGLELLLVGPEPSRAVAGLRGVRWLGYVSDTDLRALYGCATVVAYPSAYEGFGLPVLEALACGAPVVTSAATALAEVYEGRAVLVPHDDPMAWRSALARLLDEPDERRRQIERGQAWALRQRWESSAGELRARLASYVGSRP